MWHVLLVTAATLPSVLVVGGSGRVGGSTLRWLRELSAREGAPLALSVGGRSRASFERAASRLRSRYGVVDLDFVPLDLDAPASLAAAVAGRACVIHTAGPFQQREDPALLKACIDARVPYCDVCDELALSRNAQLLSERAASAGVPAVLSCGIWPGVSALLAAEAISRLGASECRSLDLSFFTAGTGGAGPTIVSATFLLLCQAAITVADGREVGVEPWTSARAVDFGPGVGTREVFLLDNPDVPTCARALGVRACAFPVPSLYLPCTFPARCARALGVRACASRFGTAPRVWNSLFGALKLLPRSLLSDEGFTDGLARFSMPLIRAVDALVGATNAMRVDATAEDGSAITLRVAHADLES
jgi:short subunit dehydrogenase-like uncharacterized protein